MIQYIKRINDSLRRGDKVLMLLCLITTAFGCLVIASSTNYMGSTRFVLTQIVASLIGLVLFAIMSSVDAEFFAERRTKMVIFNCLLLMLLIPFGTDNDSGNRSWLDFPFLPINIQPAEICKITFILIMASVMAANQNKISSFRSVFQMVFHLGLLVGLNIVLSHDAGVSLIFVFIFIGMAFAGGVSLFWFLTAAGGMVVAAPILWKVMSDYQKLRIQILFDPSLDAAGIGPRHHTMQSLRSLTGGGFTGQGLFEGHRTQGGMLFAQHTDYIFSSIGEELGFLGCIFAMVLLGLIIARCIWVGCHSQDYPRRLICFGAASALIFQVISNVGMCIGITPVIGLTLPFISYGGSSIVSLYAMLGLVSGVYARPSPASHERYIRPPYMTGRLR